MKKLTILTAVFFAMLSLGKLGTSYGEEKFVTSKTLSVDDVAPYIQYYIASLERPVGGRQLTKVYGIHQQGNTATVFYRMVPRKNYYTNRSIDIVRLNSGKWFHPSESKYITR